MQHNLHHRHTFGLGSYEPGPIFHCDLGESLPVLQVEDVVVIVGPQKHFLGAPHDNANTVAVAQHLSDVVIVDRDEPDEGEPDVDEGDAKPAKRKIG